MLKAVNLKNNKIIVHEMNVEKDRFYFLNTISDALTVADTELYNLEEQPNETIETVKLLTTDCDKYDYILSACSGALCGIIDVFLVGKPGESPLGNVTDKWFADRTVDFAKLCGYKGDEGSLLSAIKHLEKRFKVPYDQSVGGGMFFSILNQFTNTSAFVASGELITLTNSDGKFELEGNNILSKIFCGIANWLGHLVSDISGSSTSKGRGMGIPSPLLAWSNDVIAIKRKLNIPASEFDKSMNELALKLFEKGYDVRFQTTQAIPVFINEMVVRLIYSVRRLIKYYTTTSREERSFSNLWKACEPFLNATVKRMLTVAHGTFCIVDISDATIRGFATGRGSFNVVGFLMRLNVVGIGRFTISLYGEIKRGVQRKEAKMDAMFISRNKIIVEDYIEGLKTLSAAYDDDLLLKFIDDFKTSDLYVNGFNKTVEFARLRKVPEEKIIKSKAEIDSYFQGGH